MQPAAQISGAAGTMTFKLNAADKERLLPAVTVGESNWRSSTPRNGGGGRDRGYTASLSAAMRSWMRNPEGVTFNHFGAKLAKQNIERMKYVEARRLLA